MSTAPKEEEQKINRNMAEAKTIGSPRAIEEPALVPKENNASHVMTRTDALPSLGPATTTTSPPDIPMHSKSPPPPREGPIVTAAEIGGHKERNIQDERDSDGLKKPPVNDNPVPRAPHATYKYSRTSSDYEKLQRVKVQLIKTRDELERERKLYSQMQRKVEAETQVSYSAAVANMLNDLLCRQSETLAAKAKYEGKWRELQHREDRIAQLEGYLSTGQAQLKYELEQQGIRPMRAVDEAKLKSEVELSVKRQYADIEGKIAIQVERLRLQDAAQKIREQQYKALLRPSLEREIREELCQSSHAVNDAKATEGVVGEHRRTDSKAEASEMQPNRAFLEGYAACNRAQNAIYNMRNGDISPNSPELAFLFDPTHPENSFNVGRSIGRLEKAVGATATSGMTAGEMNGKKERPTETETDDASVATTVIVDGDRSQSDDNKASQAPQIRAQVNRPVQQVETHFTSSSGFCTKVHRLGSPITQEVIGVRTAGDCDSVCAERSMMHYEQEEIEPEAGCADANVVEEVKLIDL